MYSENNTQEIILNRMIQNTSNDVNKLEGGLTYDALSPASNELAQAYISLDQVASKFDLSNLSDEELETRVYQRTGLTKNAATYAHTIVTVTGNGSIKAGALCQTLGQIQFQFIEAKTINGTDTINVQALVAGSSGMVPANQITQFPVSIPGITSVTNPEPTEDGFDEESDSSLLERYYEKIQTPSTQGNIAQFISLTKDYSGVGDVKVYPTWNGNNTVKLVIIDANKQPPSSDLVNSVQTYMDPLGDTWGQGYGAAPYGAFTTIEGAAGKTIDISFTAVKDSSVSDDIRLANVESSITAYLESIAFKETQVSYAKVNAAILASAGILDLSNLLINGGTANVPLSYTKNLTECPIMGAVTID